MKNKVNQELQKQFNRQFNNAKKLYESELKQRPFVMGTNPNGFKAVFCQN